MRSFVYIVLIVGVVAIIVLAQVEKLSTEPAEQLAVESTTTDPISTTAETVGTTTTDTALISVTAPLPGETVGSPITARGEARGYWFFEGDAPVVVTNWDGLIIGEGYITAHGDWMNEDLVPFTGAIAYTLPADSYSASGTVIFQRDNPSGRPENDAAHEIPVQLVR